MRNFNSLSLSLIVFWKQILEKGEKISQRLAPIDLSAIRKVGANLV